MNKNKLNLFDWTMILGTVTAIILCAVFFVGIEDSFMNGEWWFTSVASVFNILCCVLAAKAYRSNFIFGFIFNAMYTVYCFQTQHYGNSAVYGLCFLPLQIIGYIQWNRIGTAKDSEQVAAKRLNTKQRVMLFFTSLVATALICFILFKVGGRNILVDSICTVLCIIAQLMLTFAFMEQWFFWIAVNVLSITMWTLSAFNGGSSLADLNLVICYSFILLNSINGLITWRRLSKTFLN